jgi:hypothetical protein
MIERRVNVLSEEMRKASSFLATNWWAEFHQDLLRLLDLMEKQISHLARDLARSQKNQLRTESKDADKIHKAITVEPTKNPALVYHPLTVLLVECGDYKHTIVTSEHIDKWMPATCANETQEAARTRRKRFQDRCLLSIATGSFQYHVGGPIPSFW